MEDHARENLAELLRRFMADAAAQAAQDDIEAGERLLEAHPAPAPSRAAVSGIKILMREAAVRRRRRIRLFRAAAAVAAALILTALIGLRSRSPNDRPGVHFASLIPAAVWESDDLTADDLDLAYFTSEVRQIESQVQALESGDTEVSGNDTLDELEIELIAIETEFWKG